MAYKCDNCSKAFPVKRYLAKHVKRMHSNGPASSQDVQCDDEAPSHTCAVCKKVFARLSLLVRHEKRHINESEWLCSFCKFSCKEKHMHHDHADRRVSDLVGTDSTVEANSIDLTKTVRSVVCSGGLKDDEKSAESSRKQKKEHTFACTRCGKVCASDAELRHHRVACFKINLFQCLKCLQTFSERSKLDRHWTLRHFENNACPCCRLVHASVTSLRKHFVSVHNVQRCQYCGCEDTSADHFQTHWRKLKKSSLPYADRPSASQSAAGVTFDVTECNDDEILQQTPRVVLTVPPHTTLIPTESTFLGRKYDIKAIEIPPDESEREMIVFVNNPEAAQDIGTIDLRTNFL